MLTKRQVDLGEAFIGIKIKELTSGATGISVGSILYFAEWGDNDTAQTGNAFFPYRNAQTALDAAKPMDVVAGFPGEYNENLLLPKDVILIGYGVRINPASGSALELEDPILGFGASQVLGEIEFSSTGQIGISERVVYLADTPDTESLIFEAKRIIQNPPYAVESRALVVLCNARCYISEKVKPSIAVKTNVGYVKTPILESVDGTNTPPRYILENWSDGTFDIDEIKLLQTGGVDGYLNYIISIAIGGNIGFKLNNCLIDFSGNIFVGKEALDLSGGGGSHSFNICRFKLKDLYLIEELTDGAIDFNHCHFEFDLPNSGGLTKYNFNVSAGDYRFDTCTFSFTQIPDSNFSFIDLTDSISDWIFKRCEIDASNVDMLHAIANQPVAAKITLLHSLIQMDDDAKVAIDGVGTLESIGSSLCGTVAVGITQSHETIYQSPTPINL